MAIPLKSPRSAPIRHPRRTPAAAALCAWVALFATAASLRTQPPAAGTEALPRQVLLLTTVPPDASLEDVRDLPATRWLRTPLDHLGVRAIVHGLEDASPPPEAGTISRDPVLVWIDGGAQVPSWLPDWLLRRSTRSRVILLGDPDRLQAADADATDRLWDALGFAPRTGYVDDPLRIRVHTGAGVSWFESPPRRSPLHRGGRSTEPGHRVWVYTEDERDASDRRDHVVTGSFGALVRQPFLLDLGDARLAPRWHLDPLPLFRAALGIEGAPVPDPHVVHGRRAFYWTVGSEGLTGRSTVVAGRSNPTVLLERLLDELRLPVTVSIDTSQVAASAPTERAELVASLRQLAARSFVEVALQLPTSGAGTPPAPSLETAPAMAGLDRARRRLETWTGAPCRAVFWRAAGAHDDAERTRTIRALGLAPVPVEPFRLDDLHRSRLGVPPLGHASASTVGAAAAQRAPVEALYPEFFADLPGVYRHADTTLQHTGSPRFRLAASLRPQFHTAEHPARLEALENLLRRWTAERAETCVVYAEQHLRAARESLHPERCQVLRRGSAGFDFVGFDACRTVRIDRCERSVDWDRSPGIVGARRSGTTLWLDLGGPEAAVRWQAPREPAPARPHLEQADRRMVKVTRDDFGIECTLDPRVGAPRVLTAAGFPADTELTWRLLPGGTRQSIRSDALGRVRLPIQSAARDEPAQDVDFRTLRIEVAR